MKFILHHLLAAKEVLLYAYIWQIPFSWRFIIDPSRSSWNPQFNEYMDISLYFGEVLILFALLTHILEYKNVNKSILKYIENKIRKLFHVEQNTVYLYIGILLLSINVLLSSDQALSVVSTLHFAFFGVFMYLFFDTYVSRGTKFIENVFYITCYSLIFQFIIALTQFLAGSSAGLYFLSESKLSLEIENVAKSNIFSNTYLRSYGTFPHPNILAAYSLSVLVSLMYFVRSELFHVKHFLYGLVFIVSLLLLILTQSKISIFLSILVLIWFLNEKYKLFHVKHFTFVILISVISIIQLIYLNHDAKSSFQTRIDQFSLQSVFTVKDFVIGSGIGTYRISYDEPAVEWWNYEPVHFVPMILLKELGAPLLSIIVTIWILNFSVPRGTLNDPSLTPVLIFMAGIIATDHYTWDIYQGTSVFVTVLLLLCIDKYNKIYHNMSTSEK